MNTVTASRPSAAAAPVATAAKKLVLDDQAAIRALRGAVKNHQLDLPAFKRAVEPYGALLSRPGAFRSTVEGLLKGVTDETVFAPAVKRELARLMKPPSQADAIAAFKKAAANGTLSAAEVKSALEPYALTLRQPGTYRDMVSALVGGRTDQSIKLSKEATAFFKREGLSVRW